MFELQVREDPVSRCWIYRMSLGSRHVEARETFAEVAAFTEDAARERFWAIRDRMQRQLLRDQQEARMAEAREIIYEITLRDGFDPTITARRASASPWAFGSSVQETIRGGVISNAVLENYKCILRRRLEEREERNRQTPYSFPWANSWEQANLANSPYASQMSWPIGRVLNCNENAGTVDVQINGLGDLMDLPREER